MNSTGTQTSQHTEDIGTLLVTGSAGFIGSNFVLEWIAQGGKAVSLDRLTYAGNRSNLASLNGNPRHVFVHGDICDAALVGSILLEHRPQAIIHFAAESHVDRAITDPSEFIRTNVHGTFTLLNRAKSFFEEELSACERQFFRFVHISTDEVYGSLDTGEPAFTENSPYAPNNPYAASKAASDHLVRAYHQTYGLPTLTLNCSNTYGPFQFPEKLIPLMILNALEGKPLPVYGDGQNVRDWLFVGDHCSAIRTVLRKGRSGESYNVGGNAEKANVEVVMKICGLLDEIRPNTSLDDRCDLVTFVTDRPGHDRRYAMDSSKITRELGWKPTVTFEAGMRRTVAWYLEHPEWSENVRSGAYRDWIRQNYDARTTRTQS
jgi:dTDP-glucose 4,6-dehydratase